VLPADRKEFDMSAYQQRYVALEIFYLGWNYHGFASQADTEETIEVKSSAQASDGRRAVFHEGLYEHLWAMQLKESSSDCAACFCRAICSPPCARQSSYPKVSAGKAWGTRDVGAQTKESARSGRCWRLQAASHAMPEHGNFEGCDGCLSVKKAAREHLLTWRVFIHACLCQ
jgi:hypothetical protein